MNSELMHLQITVYKDTGKFYTSCEVLGPNISSDFHNCLIKMNDLLCESL